MAEQIAFPTAIEDGFKDVAAGPLRQILCENARRLYGLN